MFHKSLLVPSILDLPRSNGTGVNGWDANEMFRQNAEKYGVQSSYDPSLKDYTTPLAKDDSEEFKRREKMAERLAKEIEESPQVRSRNQRHPPYCWLPLFLYH